MWTSPDDEELGELRLLLGAALTARFEQTGDVADLDEALRVLDDIERVEPGDSLAAAAANARGIALRRRHRVTGDRTDVEGATDAFEHAADLLGIAESDGWLQYRTNFANTLADLDSSSPSRTGGRHGARRCDARQVVAGHRRL